MSDTDHEIDLTPPQCGGEPPPPPPPDPDNPVSATDMAEIARVMVEKAKDRDYKAAEIVRRLWRGRRRRLGLILPPVHEAADVAIAQQALVSALGADQLTPREALDVATILEYRRRAIETSNDDTRLKELERIAQELTASKPKTNGGPR
jgi:hypothetical protein